MGDVVLLSISLPNMVSLISAIKTNQDLLH